MTFEQYAVLHPTATVEETLEWKKENDRFCELLLQLTDDQLEMFRQFLLKVHAGELTMDQFNEFEQQYSYNVG